VRLVAADLPPFARDALARAVLDAGGVVLAESPDPTLADAPAATLTLSDWRSDLWLTGRRASLARSADLRLRVELIDARGRIVHVDQCHRTRTDALPGVDPATLEDALLAETIARRPPPSLGRRLLEPLVAGSAVAVGILLLFSVRS
jgi:hypothetical protein